MVLKQAMIMPKGFLKGNTLGKNNKKYNTYNIKGSYGVGYTSNTNEEFYFDLEDYHIIKDFCWHKSFYGYLESRDSGSNKIIKMHKLLVDVSDIKLEIDHADRNKMNNRRKNLRVVTRTFNNINQNATVNSKTGVRGVYKNKKREKYDVSFQAKGVSITKRFDTFDDACKYRKQLEETYLSNDNH